MDSTYFTNPLIFLISIIFQAMTLIVLFRFLLQWARADFHNPLSQFIVKATSPVLVPMRRVIPPIKGLDTASLILAWLLQALELLLIFWLAKGAFMPLFALMSAIPGLLELVINVFLVAIIIQVILSWIPSGAYHPITGLLHSLTRPLMTPLGKIMPSTGGIDFTPMVAVLGLMLAKMLLLPPLDTLASYFAT